MNWEGEAIKMKWKDSGGRKEDTKTKLWFDVDLTSPEQLGGFRERLLGSSLVQFTMSV